MMDETDAAAGGELMPKMAVLPGLLALTGLLAADARPNVLFLVADDMRPWLGVRPLRPTDPPALADAARRRRTATPTPTRRIWTR